jgi:ABC-type multidrug transport system ATPase subunit
MVIQLDNCGKSFNRNWLFRNINCQLNAGEKWAFLGNNGSGKSTLTLMLIAQVWPTEGKVTWSKNGSPIDASDVYSQISLASPAMELLEEFSLKEIVEMQARLKPFLMPNPLEEMASLCGFENKTINKSLATFSSGMKQRVKLCLAGMADTQLLALDEPLTNLDAEGAKVFHTIIEKYAGNRILVIASNREDEYQICNRFIKINADKSIEIN